MSLVALDKKNDEYINFLKKEYGFKSKKETLNFIVEKFRERQKFEVREDYIKKLKKISKGKHYSEKEVKEVLKSV